MPDNVKQFLLEALSADGVAEQAKEILTAYKLKTSGERNNAESGGTTRATKSPAISSPFVRPDLTV